LERGIEMFDNLKIRAKIGAFSTVLMLFIVLLSGVGFVNLTKANKAMITMYNDRLLAIEQLNYNRANARAVESDIKSVIIHSGEPQEQKEILQDINSRGQLFDEQFERYKKTKLDQFEIDTIKVLEDNLLKYRDEGEEVISLAMRGKREEAFEAYHKIEKTIQAFQQNLEDLANYNVKIAHDLNNQNNIEYANTIKIFITILIISLLISIVLSVYITRVISEPIYLTINHMIELANYDITRDVSSRFMTRKDEMGDLARAIQRIKDQLRDLIEHIGDTSQQVAASAQELTYTSQQSVASAEEVAKTIDEIARGTSDQAENTAQGSEELMELGNIIEEERKHVYVLNESSNVVNSLVGQGLDILNKLATKTKESSDATENVYESIKKTNESSDKISEASTLIASMAEQTNLLALNAAIEAARAGEHGKGFAVVAEEIRKLAEQSAESTKIIDDMVKVLQQDSQKAVEIMESVAVITKDQMKNMNLTENKFNEMSDAINRSREAVDIIKDSGIQIEQKKNGVLDMIQTLSAVAEENAAGTEEASASMEEQSSSMEEIANSSEALSRLSQELQELVAKFKI
jgi:methyl-accepting chemotaxis protein